MFSYNIALNNSRILSTIQARSVKTVTIYDNIDLALIKN